MVELEGYLRRRASHDQEFRLLLASLGRWLSHVAAENAAMPVAESVDGSAPGASEFPISAIIADEVALPTAAPVETVGPEHLRALLDGFGSGKVSPIVQDPIAPAKAAAVASRRSVLELEVYARRLELKADACKWAVRRYDADAAGEGFGPVKADYNALRTRADTMQPCYLWMIHKDTVFIARDDWERLEACCRACAEALRCIVDFPDEYERSEDLLKLLGEAQSAIRAAMSACGAHPRWTDLDQQFLFDWCRDEGARRGVFNEFLALDSLADPSLHAGLRARIANARREIAAGRDAQKKLRRGLNTIRYHIGQLRDDAEHAQHHWQRIAEGTAEVLASGAAPSDPDLVSALAPVADDLPAEFVEHEGLRSVLRYVDDQLAAADREDESAATARREPTPEILKVREALRGKTVVLIGGSPRRRAAEMIEREFELAKLDWLFSREHGSIAPFEAAIARPETRLVIVMIRWSSHSFEEVQEMCERYEKVYVRLPGGYNPAQIAHQILAQASAQLGLAPP
ncbi:MAG: hypothetical protein KF699_00805 [Phycisphaeraceae bacterium]|nr:hypothetical protein [Phycisphaeraceae bacterium]